MTEPLLVDLNNPDEATIRTLRKRALQKGKEGKDSGRFEELPSNPDEAPADASEEFYEEDEEGPELSPFQEELLVAFLWTMLFLLLFIAFDIAASAQYAQHTSLAKELSRLSNFAPGLAFVIFYTNRYADVSRFARLQLFLMSVAGGSRMVWILNREGYVVILQQAPALAVLWIWAVWKLPLLHAILSLLLVAGYSWWKDLDYFTLVA